MKNEIVATLFFPGETAQMKKSQGVSVFLAGTIEMGDSIDWQAAVTRQLLDLPINIFNPRRVVAPEDDLIVEQITWELDSIARCQIIFMFLAADTISPISLYELGLLQGGLAENKQVILCCDPGYTRKNNVVTTTSHPLYHNPNIFCTHSLSEAIDKLKSTIESALA